MDEELLIFHPTHDLIVYCNRTAGLVWTLCNGERTVLGIAHLLAQTYPESEAMVMADVVAAAETLLEKGALVMAQAPEAAAAAESA